MQIMLLDHGADVNEECPSGLYGAAVVAACMRHDIQLCQILLKVGTFSIYRGKVGIDKMGHAAKPWEYSQH